ncbi:MAG: 3-oxoacyl-ACP synthase III [Opitutales bacterium]
MHFKNVVLESIDYAIAPLCWSSAEIEEKLKPLYDRLKLPAGRLELMTGIRERRFWPNGALASSASAEAGAAVLRKTALPRERIDLIVHAGVCRDRLEPATAAYVHQQLGLGSHTQFLDVSNACLGFLNAIILAGGLIEAGQIRSALIVSGENGGPLVERTIARLLEKEWTRREIKPFFANLTIGSGAVAAVISHRSLAENGAAILGGAGEAATQHNRLCEGDSSGSDALEMLTDSEELLVAGVELASRTWNRFKEETGWNETTADRVICHQVGSMHRLKLYETLGLDLERDFSTFPNFGNMGSVSLPFTLARAVEEGKVRKGDKVALLGIGSGISSMMVAVEW